MILSKNRIKEIKKEVFENQAMTEKDFNIKDLCDTCLDLINKNKLLRYAFDYNKTDPNYEELARVLNTAYQQAANGKGKERHAEGEPFEEQIICEVARRVGLGYTSGQAVKKIYESKRLPKDAAIAELLGAINYIAANIIVLEEESE